MSAKPGRFNRHRCWHPGQEERTQRPGNGGDETAAGKPTIIVRAGEHHLAADDGLAALQACGVPFYRRDKNLVRILRIKRKLSDGSDVLVPGVVLVTMPMLLRALGSSAHWRKFNSKREKVSIDPQPSSPNRSSAWPTSFPHCAASSPRRPCATTARC
jgi:hypothetical protein